MPVVLRVYHPPRDTRAATPALLTGTSSEYLGRRAIPHILRDRPIVVVLGPEGSGKTSVALRLAGARHMRLTTQEVQDSLVQRVKESTWHPQLLSVPSLVLDGPCWLRNRPAAVDRFCELLRVRAASGRRTVVVQCDSDGSVEAIIRQMEPGRLVVLGLRFPKGQRGRLRFARRVCDELGLSRAEARGADMIEPWGYEQVIEYLAGRVQKVGP